jgi:ficolin
MMRQQLRVGGRRDTLCHIQHFYRQTRKTSTSQLLITLELLVGYYLNGTLTPIDIRFDFVGDAMSRCNGMQFSTIDKDNDALELGQCALLDRGGWWYEKCQNTNPNGYYWNGPYDTDKYEGICWRQWHGFLYSLPFMEMKMRPI